MKRGDDALGQEICNYYEKKSAYEVVEREDGWIGPSAGPKRYFSEFEEWHPHEREAMRFVAGRVLDIGCGAGRHALYLQQKGLPVVGIDSSPLALEVCRKRGLKDARLIGITEIDATLGQFDTILMLGNNFSLFGNPKKARRPLRRFHAFTSDSGKIIAETVDPYDTEQQGHLAYHAWNRQRGKMAGQLRIRVRYLAYKGPWFECLIVSRQEMTELLVGTGWEATRFIPETGRIYVAILEKS